MKSEKYSTTAKQAQTTQQVSHLVSSSFIGDSRAFMDMYAGYTNPMVLHINSAPKPNTKYKPVNATRPAQQKRPSKPAKVINKREIKNLEHTNEQIHSVHAGLLFSDLEVLCPWFAFVSEDALYRIPVFRYFCRHDGGCFLWGFDGKLVGILAANLEAHGTGAMTGRE